jgi:TolB protein
LDGQKIAFVRTQNVDGVKPDAGIFVMNADGSKPVQLIDHGCRPTWSPDGSRIAFTSACMGDSDIYVMDAGGAHPTSLTSDQMGRADSPVWSPDGKKILYVVETFAGADRTLNVMNADGSQKIQLAAHAYPGPSPWSPDGNKIVFADMPVFPVAGTLHVVNADGSSNVPINTGSLLARSPAWSPDGSTMAYICLNGTSEDICTVASDGSGATILTHGGLYATVPRWSPDSSKLLFLASASGYVIYEAFIIQRDGSQRRQLTSTPSDQYTSDAVWAPDGSKIALVRGVVDNVEIYVLGIGE